MKFLAFGVFICLTQIIQYSFANKCRNYEITLESFRNAKDDQIAAVETIRKHRPDMPDIPDIRVDENCQLFLRGCITIKTPITYAKLSYKVKKGTLDLLEKDDVDLCEILKDSGYPTGCPLNKPPVARICDDFKHPIQLAKYADILPKLVGLLNVVAVVETNGGKKSFFELVLKVAKKK